MPMVELNKATILLGVSVGDEQEPLTLRQRARLVNTARKLDISLDADGLAWLNPPPETESVTGEERRKEPLRSPSASALLPNPPQAQTHPHSASSLNDGALGIKIRSLADAGVKWPQMREMANLWLDMNPSAARAAYTSQMAFLSGDEANFAEWLAHALSKVSDPFWLLIQEDLRVAMLPILWRHEAGRQLLLESLWAAGQENAALLPLERFAVFNLIWQRGAVKETMLYFRGHQQDLLQALVLHGDQLGFTVPNYLLKLGSLAASVGLPDLARKLLELISPDQTCYQDAVSILMQLKYKPGAASDRLEMQFLKLVEWRDKVQFIEQHLTSIRRQDSDAMLFRPELNTLLATILETVPDDLEIISHLMSVWAQNLDLYIHLPNLVTQLFSRQAKLIDVNIDSSFWAPISLAPCSDTTVQVLVAIAKMRLVLAHGLGFGTTYWEVRDLLLKYDRTSVRNLFQFSLAAWKSELIESLDKGHYHRAAIKMQSLSLLHALVSDERVLITELEQLIDMATIDSSSTLDHLLKISRSRKSYAFELQLLSRRAELSHFRQQDLERIWQLSQELVDPDLAWRTATILQARHVLRAEVSHARDFCGVDKQDILIELPKATVRQLMIDTINGFAMADRALLQFITNVGPSLPFLIKLLKPKAPLAGMPPTQALSLMRAKLGGALGTTCYERVPLLGGGPSGSGEIGQQTTQVEQIAQILANTFGVQSLGYSLQRLSDLLDDRFPILTGKKYAAVRCTKTNQWFEQLSKEGKSALLSLKGRLADFPDAQCHFLLRSYILRLTLLFTQNHLGVLKMAQQDRLNLPIFWETERYIASEEYGKLRQKYSWVLNGPVPASLLKLTSITLKPGG